jgi:hypothetical protein
LEQQHSSRVVVLMARVPWRRSGRGQALLALVFGAPSIFAKKKSLETKRALHLDCFYPAGASINRDPFTAPQ